MQVGKKVAKLRNIAFFVQWVVTPEGRKVGSLKRPVRSHLGRWDMKICTLLLCEAHFEVEMRKARHAQDTLGSCDVKKVHAAVPRSTFTSQNVQTWKHYMFGPFLDIQMSSRRAGARKSAPLRRWAKRQGFAAVSKASAGGGLLKATWKMIEDAFCVAGAVHSTFHF